jgi:hypothetical protein
MDPEETAKILRHLIKTGKSPPGFNQNSLTIDCYWSYQDWPIIFHFH